MLSGCGSEQVLSLLLSTEARVDGDDDAKQADSAAKDFHNEDLHEEVGVLGVGQSRSAAHDANADATEEVGEADSQTGSEHGVLRRLHICRAIAAVELRKVKAKLQVNSAAACRRMSV
ncbi:hypothetical protein EYF80_022311 [Liparis tanakae]|uniref:Uncharacterized protein n=1 Tax=Liparis tanakae TaxID=230148 RepID=A0A4Z2HQE3_9TELE|nr:hypothetical protein EYF80_022311 [Liparis tanakae]